MAGSPGCAFKGKVHADSAVRQDLIASAISRIRIRDSSILMSIRGFSFDIITTLSTLFCVFLNHARLDRERNSDDKHALIYFRIRFHGTS